jgi:hypothetical protein
MREQLQNQTIKIDTPEFQLKEAFSAVTSSIASERPGGRGASGSRSGVADSADQAIKLAADQQSI